MIPFSSMPGTAYLPFLCDGFLCSCKTCKHHLLRLTDVPCSECFELQLQSRFPDRSACSYEPEESVRNLNYRVVSMAVPGSDRFWEPWSCAIGVRDDPAFSPGAVLYSMESHPETGEFTGRFRVDLILEVKRSDRFPEIRDGFCVLQTERMWVR